MLFPGMVACALGGLGAVTAGVLVSGKLAAGSGTRSFVLAFLAYTQQSVQDSAVWLPVSPLPFRLLESRPPLTSIFYEYPGPAHDHRRVWFLWDAQGLLPLSAGWLETWDSGNVWPTQGQRKGKGEEKACFVLLEMFHRGSTTDTNTFLLGVCLIVPSRGAAVGSCQQGFSAVASNWTLLEECPGSRGDF